MGFVKEARWYSSQYVFISCVCGHLILFALNGTCHSQSATYLISALPHPVSSSGQQAPAAGCGSTGPAGACVSSRPYLSLNMRLQATLRDAQEMCQIRTTVSGVWKEQHHRQRKQAYHVRIQLFMHKHAHWIHVVSLTSSWFGDLAYLVHKCKLHCCLAEWS